MKVRATEIMHLPGLKVGRAFGPMEWGHETDGEKGVIVVRCTRQSWNVILDPHTREWFPLEVNIETEEHEGTETLGIGRK